MPQIIKCEWCEVSFKPYRKTQIYCSKKCSGMASRRQIITNCCNCGVDFLSWPSKKQKYCSVECANVSFSERFKGENNPNFDNHKLKGKRRTLKDRKKIKDGILQSWQSPSRMEKHKRARERYKEKHGFYPTDSPEAKDKVALASALRSQTNVLGGGERNYKRGHYVSSKTNTKEYYHSSYELERMKQLDNDGSVGYWTKKHKIIIRYELDGKLHRYSPDFLINSSNGIILEEVKGWVKNETEMIAKTNALKLFCQEYNYKPCVNFMRNRNKWQRFALDVENQS